MTSWTKEQQEAISKDHTNIIVSAGAGSGKTAVLTQRVIRKLKDGVDINHLLVLTFTEAAAGEMKARIRKEIKKDPNLKTQLDFLDSSYITTFDSFSLSIVKKYSYVLNISKNIKIIDSSIINILKRNFLEEIFEDLYQKKDENFVKLINDFCVKDDREIKDAILTLNSKLDLKANKNEYLDNYINNYFNKEYINTLVVKYTSLLVDKIKKINEPLENILSNEETKISDKFYQALNNLLNATSYDDIKNNLTRVSQIRVKNSKEDKEIISDIIKQLETLTIYDNQDEIVNDYLMTKDYVIAIIDIIKKLDEKVLAYKSSKNSYEFNDISKMAIKIVRDFADVKKEQTLYYNEIMVDEYQDTSDLQEAFINEISNNNVYMVGDIKQSIYRFRNANPTIFKNKYNSYANNNGGYKIDLLKNFRSRKEVLEDINIIFNKIMDNTIGGADYSVSHQMIFGNENYIKAGLTNQNNNLEIYNYNIENKDFKKEEIEIFIIANDIKNKIDSNYIIFDKDDSVKRPITYNDICIILDRGTDFKTYQKIFEYVGIPLNVYKDEDLTSSSDITLIKNILEFIIKIKDKQFDTKFKYLYTSIARSYLFEIDDNLIFNTFKDNNFYQNEIFITAQNIANNLNLLSPSNIIFTIIKKFKIVEKAIKTSDIEKLIIRMDYLQKIGYNLDELGFTPVMLKDYLEEMINSKDEIRYKLGTSSANCVKLMNIHKSKGLEFPICYFAGLYKPFNISDINDRFIYDSKYGIITPFFKDGLGDIMTKQLAKQNYLLEEISEKIRLLYVALTRTKEKMIMVTSLKDDYIKNNNIVDNNIRLKYNSFLDIINSVKEELTDKIVNIDLKNIPMSKDFNLIRQVNYKDYIKTTDEKINKKTIKISDEKKDKKHFSKTINDLITKEDKNNMELGTKMHYIFEITDFNNITIEDNFYKDKILKFLNQDIMKNYKQAKIYKEYEFMYESDNETYNGIIDLMLVYKDYVDIIDYKLNSISDKAYLNQLNGYKRYIEKITNKKVNVYLYSILSNEMVSLNL